MLKLTHIVQKADYARTRAHPERFSRPSRSWTVSCSSLALSGGSASSLQTQDPISTATPALIYHRGRDRQHICARTDRVKKEGKRRRDNSVGGGWEEQEEIW